MRLVVAQLALLALWDVHAQPAPTPLTFEVASVKPSAPDGQGMFFQPQAGGDLRIAGATLKNLIAYAYGVREFAVAGGAAWVSSDRFDINARASTSPDPGASGNRQQVAERLKSLLAERFELAIHSETKEQDAYELVVGGKGPKFAEAKPETPTFIRRQGTIITGEAAAMQSLAMNLANAVGRPVLDKTGLTGKYDFKLDWTPEAALSRSSQSAAGAEIPLASDPTAASLFAALQKQLGLRLESRKAPGQVLVVDHAARPSPD